VGSRYRSEAEIGCTLDQPDGGFGRYECVEHRGIGAIRV